MINKINSNPSKNCKNYYHEYFLRLTGQQGKGGDLLLFHSTTSTRSRTFRHLFATLHVRWLSHIFNRTVCIYQTATWWDVPPYRITNWLIDDMTFSFCLFMWWFDSSFFCYSDLRRKIGRFELASIIAFALQANWLTKCASYDEHNVHTARTTFIITIFIFYSYVN